MKEKEIAVRVEINLEFLKESSERWKNSAGLFLNC